MDPKVALRKALLSADFELLKKNIDPNLINQKNILDLVINRKVEESENKNEIFDLIISKGGDLRFNDDFLLVSACKNGFYKISEILIQKGLKVDSQNQAPLYNACICGDKYLIIFLLSNGALFRVNSLYDFCSNPVVVDVILQNEVLFDRLPILDSVLETIYINNVKSLVISFYKILEVWGKLLIYRRTK